MSSVRVVALISATGHDTSDSLRCPCQAGRLLRMTLSFDALFGFLDERALFAMAGFP